MRSTRHCRLLSKIAQSKGMCVSSKTGFMRKVGICPSEQCPRCVSLMHPVLCWSIAQGSQSVFQCFCLFQDAHCACMSDACTVFLSRNTAGFPSNTYKALQSLVTNDICVLKHGMLARAAVATCGQVHTVKLRFECFPRSTVKRTRSSHPRPKPVPPPHARAPQDPEDKFSHPSLSLCGPRHGRRSPCRWH